MTSYAPYDPPLTSFSFWQTGENKKMNGIEGDYDPDFFNGACEGQMEEDKGAGDPEAPIRAHIEFVVSRKDGYKRRIHATVLPARLDCQC
jgi:hypothetical protein